MYYTGKLGGLINLNLFDPTKDIAVKVNFELGHSFIDKNTPLEVESELFLVEPKIKNL